MRLNLKADENAHNEVHGSQKDGSDDCERRRPGTISGLPVENRIFLVEVVFFGRGIQRSIYAQRTAMPEALSHFFLTSLG